MNHVNVSGGAAGIPHPAGQTPAVGTATPAVPKRIYETDSREGGLLLLALGWGTLWADVLLSLFHGRPSLGITVLVWVWEAVFFWYTHRKERKRDRVMAWMTAAVLALSLTFALYADLWLYRWNLLALPVLMTVQMFQGTEGLWKSWWQPTMLWERYVLLFDGLLGHLGASVQTLTGFHHGKGEKKLPPALLGILLALPVAAVVLPLLASADALFQQLTGEIITFLTQRFGSLMCRVCLGILSVPFFFGLLYSIRRPRVREGEKTAEKALRMDPPVLAVAFVVLDAIYVLFVAVQSAALFGGAEYLARAGISYAQYARSGFFQLVWVSCINLAVVVSAVQVCRREGGAWKAVQFLSTGMVALSGVMLVSACWRMSLYVGEYGLSFKRLLTYWGMIMLTIFFAGALLKIWKKEFKFFRLLFTASIAGWLMLNFAAPDALVAKYNVNAYLKGSNAVMDLPYLAQLSYDVLPVLEQLPGEMLVYYLPPSAEQAGETLDELITCRRAQAARECGTWESWTLSAWRAAKG